MRFNHIPSDHHGDTEDTERLLTADERRCTQIRLVGWATCCPCGFCSRFPSGRLLITYHVSLVTSLPRDRRLSRPYGLTSLPRRIFLCGGRERAPGRPVAR
jgi:hypothetical protein